jgi:hypothetical protein
MDLFKRVEGLRGCKACFRSDRWESTTRSLLTYRVQTRPLDAVTFMQKLTGDRLSQTKSATFTEFNHATNGLAAVFPINAAVVWKAGQSGGKHFIDRLKMSAS